MKLELANINDLLKLKEVYKKISCNMNENEIKIWDDIYPCEFFKEDIESNRLYLLKNENNNILGAFALCKFNNAESYINWENKNAKALYLERLGVNVDFFKQGIGSVLLDCATKIAKQRSVEYLRLLVVDINKPAINLYLKNKFKQAPGSYVEVIDQTLSFNEYGYEKKIE